MTTTTMKLRDANVRLCDDRFRQYRCLRCGIEVWERNAACRDCVSVAPDLVRDWKRT